ncbi:Dendrin [Manis pentadactyla]|nr:Dendrin [Manis pentadactyla]
MPREPSGSRPVLVCSGHPQCPPDNGTWGPQQWSPAGTGTRKQLGLGGAREDEADDEGLPQQELLQGPLSNFQMTLQIPVSFETYQKPVQITDLGQENLRGPSDVCVLLRLFHEAELTFQKPITHQNSAARCMKS